MKNYIKILQINALTVGRFKRLKCNIRGKLVAKLDKIINNFSYDYYLFFFKINLFNKN